jgi:hypothetical protein
MGDSKGLSFDSYAPHEMGLEVGGLFALCKREDSNGPLAGSYDLNLHLLDGSQGLMTAENVLVVPEAPDKGGALRLQLIPYEGVLRGVLEIDVEVAILKALCRDSRGLFPRDPLERQPCRLCRLPEVFPLLGGGLEREAISRELVKLKAICDEVSQKLTQ